MVAISRTMSDHTTMSMANFLRGGPMRLSNFIAAPAAAAAVPEGPSMYIPQPKKHVLKVPAVNLSKPPITKTIRFSTRSQAHVNRIGVIMQRAVDLHLTPTLRQVSRSEQEIILHGPRELVLRSLNAASRTTRKSSSGSKRKSSSGSRRATTRRRQHQ